MTALSILLGCLGTIAATIVIVLVLVNRPRYIEAVREDTGDFDA
jgi:hypothetical protein